MRVLEDEQDRTPPALAQEEPPDRIQRPRSPLARLERGPSVVGARHVEEAQERGQRPGETLVEAEHPLGDPTPDGLGFLPLEAEIRLEQVDDGQIRRPARDGHRAGLQHEARLDVLTPRELPQEPRLADARLSDQPHDLALSPHRGCPAALQEVPLLTPAHEAASAPLETQARRLRVEQPVAARPRAAGPGQGLEPEAPGQERLRGGAHQDRVRIGGAEERLEHGGRLVRRAAADLVRPGDAPDRLLARVEGDLDDTGLADRGREPAQRLLDRQRGERGATGRLVDRLETEGRAHRCLAQRLQAPAEAEHLLDREIEPAVSHPGVVGLL